MLPEAIPAAPASPAPQIVLPPELLDVPVTAATEQAQPAETTATTVAARAQPPAERSAASAPRRSGNAPASVGEPASTVEMAAAPAEPPLDSGETAMDAAPIGAERPEAVAQAAPPPAESNTGDGVPDEVLAGLAGLLGLAGVAGFLATRSRRRREDGNTAEDGDGMTADLSDEEAPATSIPESLAVPLEREPEPAVVARVGPSEPFVMPAGPVPFGRERDRLLERMVAAPSDTANPFTSRKARLRRARIILQSRETHLREESRRPFDWRTYEPPPEARRVTASAPVEVV